MNWLVAVVPTTMLSVAPNLLPWIAAAAAFGISASVTPLVIRSGRRMGWIAAPKADRWHRKPTALMGGIAIYAGATLSILFLFGNSVSVSLWLGASLMFGVGLVDDLRGIGPALKLMAQFVAAAILLYGGYAFAPGWPVWISIPLTFIWIVGLTNAVNLLDNMDGLAAGISVIAAIFLAAFTGLAGDMPDAAIAMAIGGAALGFLVFNFKPARIFMGDCGSLFLGYSLAALATVLHGQAPRPTSLAIYLVPIAVLAVPIFDTTLVTIVRTLAGRRVSEGGRDHLSHRLVVAGLSERKAVLVLYGVSLVSAGLALYLLYADVAFVYALVIYLVVGMAIFGTFLGRSGTAEYERDSFTPVERLPRILRYLLGRSWRVSIGMSMDVLLFVAAMVVAVHFRFAEGVTPARKDFLLSVIPLAIAVKLAVFYMMGIYRTMWRYAGTLEIIDIVKTTTTACLAAFGVIGVTYGFSNLAQGIFLIDWMIVTLSVLGSRLGYRGLHQFFAGKRKGGRRVLLCGSCETSLLAVRAMREPMVDALTPVGLLEEDGGRIGMVAQGLKVLGGIERAEDVGRRFRVDEILITDASFTQDQRDLLADVARTLNIPCRRFHFVYDDIEGKKVTRADEGHITADG